jgi:hypothetical protein
MCGMLGAHETSLTIELKYFRDTLRFSPDEWLPKISVVSFYRNRGFQIMGLISKQIVRDFPGDILMGRRIQKGKQTNEK